MASKKKSDTTKKKEDWTGLAIPAGLFIGMGIGMVSGYTAAGMFIGLGVGFLLTVALNFLRRKLER